MNISSLDTIYCKTDQPRLLRVKELSYPKKFWKKKGYRKEEIQYDSFLVGLDGLFLTGLLPRILEYCKRNSIEVSLQLFEHKIPNQLISTNITLREDQEKLVKAALSQDRGVIKSPTGSGKTVMAAAIMSVFSTSRILFLCHTISLLRQTKEELDRFDIGPCSIFYGKEKDLSKRIIISTIQSFSKDEILESMIDEFNVIIVDEAHHISSLSTKQKKVDGKRIQYKTGYYKVLSSIIAPIRYGFTATLQDNLESRFALEGLIGPVIGETTLKEGMEKDLLANLKISLVSVPPLENIRDYKTYQDIYQAAIVEYRKRHRLIISKAKELNSQGKSSLIYVNKIEHGEKLLDIANRMEMEVLFVRGETDSLERERIRTALNKKEIMTVIATTVWVEGINIRELDSIIMAGGGRKELSVLQKIGRSLRRTESKTEVLVVDFLDQGRYLSEHCVSRLSVYTENGWL